MGIFSEFQSMMKLFQEAGKMELYEKISKLLKENEVLKEKISALKEKLKLKKSMIFEEEVYWIKDENGNVKDEPFCPNCYDAEELTVHLITVEEDPRYKRCPKCYFGKKNL